MFTKYTRIACPEIPPAVVGWICRYATQNYWRVASWYEVDDLIQDGLMLAAKCINRYGRPAPKNADRPRRVRLDEIDAPHYTALVKAAFRNHVNDLARKKRRSVDSITDSIGDLAREGSEEHVLDAHAAPQIGLQEVAVLIAQLPTHVRQAIEHSSRNSETELRAYFWMRDNLA